MRAYLVSRTDTGLVLLVLARSSYAALEQAKKHQAMGGASRYEVHCLTERTGT